MSKAKLVAAYPLQWPDGWKRTKTPGASKFKTHASKAFDFLRWEIQRMGGTNTVISTNLPLKNDGTPRLDREPVDSGVAVYFTREEKQLVFACDQYSYVRDNLYAIGKTIEAMRGIERWGASEMMERIFTGFKQLPAQAGEGEDCWMVLGIAPMSDERMVRLSHKDLIRKLHAAQADSAEFARVNVSRDDALRALEASK
jgi:hypothetical protein